MMLINKSTGTNTLIKKKITKITGTNHFENIYANNSLVCPKKNIEKINL